MKLVTTELGQALQLFVADELRPQRGLYLPDAVNAIVKRYNFINSPQDVSVAAQGLKFETGIISLISGDIPILNLDLYNDGVIINVRHTADADAVMDDFLEWTMKTFGMREPQTRIPRQHASHVVVDFDLSIDRLIRDFDRVCRLVEAAYKKENERTNYPLHINRLVLSADPKETPPLMQTAFAIEPRANLSFTANRYFSAAPLTTNRHLEVLAAIEDVLRG